MSERNEVYRVIRGSIRLSRAKGGGQVRQGDVLPQDVGDAADIKSWLEGGRIERADMTVAQAEEVEAVRGSNPFQVDPGILVGKTMEDLIIMVLEIKDDYDVDLLVSEQDAIQLLTSGWQPSMRQTIAPVNDRSRPEALALHNLEQQEGGGAVVGSSDTQMSQAAAAGLAAARARANAPESQE